PLLAEKCYACHGALRQEGGLRLETRELWLRGGDSGAAISEQEPGKSAILERVTAEPESRMPPEGEGAPLSAEQIELLRRWLEAGAPAPAEEIPGSPQQHWAFQEIVRPAVPEHAAGQPLKNPIDAFIAAGLTEHHLVPVDVASPELRLRRLFLDITGLPPGTEQIEAFCADPSDAAFEQIADQLLNSPQYGERWGRHWMDVWRYTDWYGLGAQVRNSQKHIWHWRDWIVESLNEDKGYDRMLQEMLAGDELAPGDLNTARATGFLARQYYLFNRTTWLDDTLEHTSKAFLGITMNCVKCHAHKYDPIAHEDYYRMRAIFEPYQVRIDSAPGQTDLELDGIPQAFDAHPDAATYLHVRGDDRNPDKSRPLEPGLPAILAFQPLEVSTVTLPEHAWQPSIRPHVLEDYIRSAEAAIQTASHKVRDAESQLAAIRTEAAAPTSEVVDGGVVFLDDPFDRVSEETWETGAGEWEYADGQLIQKQTGAERAWLRTRKNPPQNFEATLTFTTTGGNMWKSVGLAWDVVGDNEKMVYLSAVSPGSKLQVSYKQNGSQVYPPAAAQPRAVALNQPYTMTVTVRDQLVNVAIDGVHAIAFEVPLKREQGMMDLIAFDAAVRFDSLKVIELPAARAMIPAGAGPGKPVTREAAELALAAANAELKAARLRPAAVRAAVEADVARAKQIPDDEESTRNAQQARELAAAAFRTYELAAAESQLAAARLKSEDTKGITAAEQALEKARKAAEAPNGEYLKLTASAKAAEGPDESAESKQQPYPHVSTGRRLAFAGWLTDRKNPLTARVAVNHIWMRHFGQPLVDPVDDFGLRTKKPVQAALLDWLAAELMENHWSMKHLHRLIVTSQAWQRKSSIRDADPATAETDPDNAYYWRRIPVRMESQIIRDSLLQLAGKLDLQVGGPSLEAGAKNVTFRRSLYFKHSRDDQHEFLSMFDDADILRCYRRSESVVPQQALALANSELSLSMAREISSRLTDGRSNVSDSDFVESAFQLVLGRSPGEDESSLCLDAMSQTRAALAGQDPQRIDRRVRDNLVHALINHNDFVTIR
ncbi:MAG: PSD1 domain-containing protein, partial [Planctomycetaceae bacterium]|nr:PSD1 domain-containing protein [Planctomycetaceae bacterium]